MKIEEILAELEAALQQAEGRPDGYMTLKEIACEWHDTPLPTARQIHRTREAMSLLKEQGRLDCVKIRREALDGRMASVSGYRVLPS